MPNAMAYTSNRYQRSLPHLMDLACNLPLVVYKHPAIRDRQTSGPALDLVAPLLTTISVHLPGDHNEMHADIVFLNPPFSTLTKKQQKVQ